MATMTIPAESEAIAPPRETFDLGQWITFHHRCGVARYLHIDKERKDLGCEWVIIEGCYKQEYANWTVEDTEAGLWPFNNLRDSWLHRPQLRWAFNKMPVRKGVNKTIVVWPNDGEGVVVGLVRREIGESVRGYTDSFSGEYEPGYFCTKSRHWLYVVKQRLPGKDTILVPMWAASERRPDDD